MMLQNPVYCSASVYKAAKKGGLRCEAFGGGVTERCYRVEADDLHTISKLLGRPVKDGAQVTHDDIPGRGRVEWRHFY